MKITEAGQSEDALSHTNELISRTTTIAYHFYSLWELKVVRADLSEDCSLVDWESIELLDSKSFQNCIVYFQTVWGTFQWIPEIWLENVPLRLSAWSRMCDGRSPHSHLLHSPRLSSSSQSLHSQWTETRRRMWPRCNWKWKRIRSYSNLQWIILKYLIQFYAVQWIHPNWASQKPKQFTWYGYA